MGASRQVETPIGEFDTARHDHRNRWCHGWAAMFVPLVLFACSDRDGDVKGKEEISGVVVAQANPAFFIGPIIGFLPDGTLAPPFDGIQSIEIDDRDNDPDTAGAEGQLNANYTSGTHGTVPHAFMNCGSNTDIDQDCPDTAVDAYGDWDDIDPTVLDLTPGAKGNHKIVDGIGNSDPTMFSPDSCVTSGSVLGKQDITETWAGNNSQYFYFGQARRENNGNSQFYWLFTQVAPQVQDVGNNCPQQLQYQFIPGDVRVRIGFPSSPNSSQELVSDLSYHKYVGTATGFIPAADALNDVLLNPGNWIDTTATAVTNYSLNTTPIAPPSSGTNSSLVTKPPNAGKVDLVEFAEGAIDLNELISGGICGKSLFISVITRPSESASSDLKDLLGPIEYSFGGVTATAELAPTCFLQISKTGSAVDATSTPITEDSAFDWTFYKCVDGCDTVNDDGTLTPVGGPDTQDGTEPDDRVGTYDVGNGAGTYFAVLKVTDPTSPTCFDFAASNSITLLTPISVNPVMTGSCDAAGSWTFNAQPNTPATCAWTFTDTNTTRVHSPTSSTDISGSGTTTRGNAALDTINGSVTCTQTRTTDDLTCQASGNASADVFAPILVDIAPNNNSLACTVPGAPGFDVGNIGPGVTYTAIASGGAGTLIYDWTVNGPNAATCADGVGVTTCVVDSPDDNFCALTQVFVTVDDGNGCAAATSETETVTKLTQVSASNAP